MTDLGRIDLTEIMLEVGGWAEENFGDREYILASIDEGRKTLRTHTNPKCHFT